jgi:hypothetical protein
VLHAHDSGWSQRQVSATAKEEDMRIRRTFAAGLLAMVAVVAVNAGATNAIAATDAGFVDGGLADAASPCPGDTLGPGTFLGYGTHVYYCELSTVGPGANVVDVLWGFDYNPANNHLRAFALFTGTAEGIAIVSYTPLNLGDRNGVLKSTTYPDAGSRFIETDPVSCHKQAGAYYLANAHLTIVWPNGQYTFPETGQLGAASSTICR